LSVHILEFVLGSRDDLAFKLEEAFNERLGLRRALIEMVIEMFDNFVALDQLRSDLLFSGENPGGDMR
jgi:hypothetical protein